MCDTSLHTTYRVCDTHIPISCAPPAEDILVLPPIPLIKLDFLPNKYARNVEYGHDLLHDAQCCNETSPTILMEEICPMVKWTPNKGIVCQYCDEPMVDGIVCNNDTALECTLETHEKHGTGIIN